jgi:hypothetical protein
MNPNANTNIVNAYASYMQRTNRLDIKNYDKIITLPCGHYVIKSVTEKPNTYAINLENSITRLGKWVYLERYSDSNEFEMWFEKTRMMAERIFIDKNDIKDISKFVLKITQLIHT